MHVNICSDLCIDLTPTTGCRCDITKYKYQLIAYMQLVYCNYQNNVIARLLYTCMETSKTQGYYAIRISIVPRV